MNHLKRISLFFIFMLLLAGCAATNMEHDPVASQLANKSEREDWFMDQSLGMFIHWSMDSQLGSVISHSMVGASDDYLDRFVNELPTTFYPKKFDPDEWARLAKLAGMKYVVFTTKHHSGFCMFDTKTTRFSINNTPYAHDITRQIAEAFRSHGISIGFYFSPDDFWMLHKQGKDVSRRRPEAFPTNNPQLMAHNKAQLRELLTRYGPINVLFIDGQPDELKELAWQLQPRLVITRGQMETPEQKTPDQPMPGPWEACYTLGTQWHYKPTNEDYKSGTQLIEMLIEIRAKGGNFLLNVGPTAEGLIPQPSVDRLRAMGQWLEVNGEAVYGTRPWHTFGEGRAKVAVGHLQERADEPFTVADIRFTTKGDTLYAICLGWPEAEVKIDALGRLYEPEIEEITMLGDDRPLRWRHTPDRLEIARPDSPPCQNAFVFRIRRRS